MDDMILREAVRAIIFEERFFEEWLSEDVVDLLVSTYAQKNPHGGLLKWEYGPLPSRVWGVYESKDGKLIVSKEKTKGLFKQQVETILHEIQHWNQHVKIAATLAAEGRPPKKPDYTFRYPYAHEFLQTYKHHEDSAEGRRRFDRYWQNPMEAEARSFSKERLDQAMSMIGKVYAVKVTGTTLDDVLNEILEEFVDAGIVTRLQIGTALREHDMNTPENMAKAIATLKELGLTVK